MVVESDESDGTFVKLPADVVIVTNIDPNIWTTMAPSRKPRRRIWLSSKTFRSMVCRHVH